MIDLGLRASEMDELIELLKSSHWIHVTIQVLKLDHTYVSDASSMLVSGQVNIKADADVTRSCTLELFDPTNSVDFISDSPSDGALYMDRMIRVVYSVAPPSKNKWFDIPVFVGPLVKVSRDGLTVKVEANGKEILSQDAPHRPKTFGEGRKKTSIIKSCLKEFSGEVDRKIDIPDLEEKAGKVKFGADSNPWKVYKSLAGSMHRHLFYDGRGVCRMRSRPNAVVFTFGERMMIREPDVSYDMAGVVNSVVVNGKKPKGSKKKVKGRATLGRDHPLSPHKLGRNGVPRYLTRVVSDNSCKTAKACRKRAREILNGLAREALEVKVDTLPMPLLEEDDPIRFSTGSFTGQAKLTEMTIPLTASGTASVGYLRRVAPRAKSIRNSRG